MEQHLILLHVILPLIAAPMVALCNRQLAWIISLLVTWVAFIISIILFMHCQDVPELRYALGGWAAPVGIEYRVDRFSSFILVLLCGVASVIIPYASASVAKEIPEAKQALFYTVYLLCLSGLLGIVTSNDVFNIYVFLEISSLATYTLIAMGHNRRALTSAFEYLILGTIGATFLLISIGLLYMMTGTLNIDDLAQRIPTVSDMRPVQAAFALLTVGLALKIALFPLHLWLTNAYTYAPSVISAFLAAIGTKVSLYVFVRLIFTMFGVSFSFAAMPLGMMLIVLGVAGIVVGSLTAIYQHDVKRTLAFSSVAQIGYISLGLALANTLGLTAAMLHMFGHALAKGSIFLAIGCVYWRMGGVTLDHFRGLGKAMPWTMAAFVIAGLSLIGVPGTAGFISKWYLLQAFYERELWSLIAILLIGSVLAVMYVWKIIEAAYFSPYASKSELRDVPIIMIVPTWILAVANVYFGLDTEFPLTAAVAAAKTLLGAAL